MKKNTAGQKWRVFAFNRNTGEPVTGDASNITATIAIDHGSATALDDTNPTEIEDGYYLFDLTRAETNGGVLDLYPQSSTSDVQVVGVPGTVYTVEQYDYKTDAFVVVADGETDADRGTNLAAAYTAAKALTPGGNAISATNQAEVRIPPGRYKLTSTLTLDTDYVNLVAICPEKGGERKDTDFDYGDGSTSLDEYRPSRTEIYSEVEGATVIDQATQRVRMKGFAIGHLFGDGDANIPSGSYHALYISADTNAGSAYEQMYFWHKAPVPDNSANNTRTPVGCAKHLSGSWKDCTANGYAFRVGHDEAKEGQFSAHMDDVVAGAYSFIGDYATSGAGTHKATGCCCRRCSAIGSYALSNAVWENQDLYGYGSFAGCDGFGMDIDETCLFIECRAGDRSYGISQLNEGTYYRCVGGDYCFGASATAGNGVFSGKAYDCVGGKGSFGGTGGTTTGGLKGTLIRCVSLNSERAWKVSEGATIVDSVLTIGTTNRNCLELQDSTCRVTGSTLLVVEGGTGVPVYASSAQSVCAVNNSYNNRSVSATGLGSNVTNTGAGDQRSLTTAAQSALVDAMDNESELLGQVAEDVAGLDGEAMRGTDDALTELAAEIPAGWVTSIVAGVWPVWPTRSLTGSALSTGPTASRSRNRWLLHMPARQHAGIVSPHPRLGRRRPPASRRAVDRVFDLRPRRERFDGADSR